MRLSQNCNLFDNKELFYEKQEINFDFAYVFFMF